MADLRTSAKAQLVKTDVGSERDPGDKFRLRDVALTWRSVGDEVVALDIDHSVYLSVNRTAAALWPALAEGATRQHLLAIALDHFRVDPERAASDIDSLLADLMARGLLEQIP